MAQPAFGATLATGGTTIAKIKSISGGGSSVAAIETSNMDADTVTNLIGLVRGKPLTFELEYEDTDTTGNYYLIQANAEARAATAWTITFADSAASTVTGNGFITDYSAPEGETESELTFTVEITPQTVWVWDDPA